MVQGFDHMLKKEGQSIRLSFERRNLLEGEECWQKGIGAERIGSEWEMRTKKRKIRGKGKKKRKNKISEDNKF